jgi:repressor LexA
MLTPRQSTLLHFIKDYQQKNRGVSPSYTEMMKHMNLASKSGINRLLEALEERGFITRIPARARAITIVRMP